MSTICYAHAWSATFCPPKGRHSEAAHEIQGYSSQKCMFLYIIHIQHFTSDSNSKINNS